MKIADAALIQAIDRRSITGFGIKGLQFMENAGRGIAEAVKKELAVTVGRRVAVIAGKGSNGGDGFVAARHLKNSGADVTVFSLARLEDIKGDAAANAGSWKKMGGSVAFILSKKDLKKHSPGIRHSSVIVDAIFGTGLTAAVKGLYADVIGLINSLDKRVVAVDVPSGIDSTTGAVHGVAVRADVTATMAMPKLGLYLYPGREHAGRVEIIDIGCPKELIEDEGIRWNLLTGGDLRRILRPRKADTHKGSYGHLLILAGSPGFTGAAYMAGMGAMRAGTGLATIGVPESLNAIMEAKTIEVMTAPLPETADGTLGAVSYGRIKELMKNKSAIIIGPGLGVSKETSGLVEMLVKDAKAPLVVDADALNSVAGNLSVLKGSKAGFVLTPHPGEMARLLKTTTEDVQADRMGAALRLSELTGATVVLKGASTVIASDGRIYINPTGNAGLATAGTGDVLAGMIGGLLAQGYPAVEAASAAAYMHGLAGDLVKGDSGETGMIATDILPYIPKVLNSFFEAAG